MKKFPIVPVAAGSIALLLLLASSSKAATTPPPPPPPPPPPNKRPKHYPNVPEGAGFGTVVPACGPNDPPECRNGLRVHLTPDTDPATRIGPDDISPTSRHLNTGDEAVLLRLDVPDQSVPPTSRIWAYVMTPMGNKGYVSFTDPQGRTNFTNVIPPAPNVDVSGVDRGFGWHSPSVGARTRAVRNNGGPYVRCISPNGCWLRAPGGTRTFVENGTSLQILPAPVVPGALFVRYLDRRRNLLIDGWVPSAWMKG